MSTYMKIKIIAKNAKAYESMSDVLSEVFVLLEIPLFSIWPELDLVMEDIL